MDSPSTLYSQHPRVLSPCSSGRRRSSTDSNSPEFEFWMVRNPSFPQPNLLSADELFVDGVLQPLHLIDRRPDTPDPEPESDQIPHQEKPHIDPPDLESVNPDREQEPGRRITSEPTTVLSVSKRWKDIFKKGEKNSKKEEEKEKEKKNKKKEKRNHGGPGVAELNINIWPFSRSRSAGNATRPRWVSGASTARKVSSAPCSRSNSAGESKSRKWPASPTRAGVHLGRSSPVWQVRRGSTKSSDLSARIGEKSAETRRGKVTGSNTNGRTKVLNLNVPMCIGYRSNSSCRSDDNRSITLGRSGGVKIDSDCGGGGADGGDTNNLGSSATLFNLRSLFAKKVH